MLANIKTFYVESFWQMNQDSEPKFCATKESHRLKTKWLPGKGIFYGIVFLRYTGEILTYILVKHRGYINCILEVRKKKFYVVL
jgi:cellobiose-specific phosphotransferase system component IIC